MPAQQPKVDLGNLENRVRELQKNLAFVGQGTNIETSELFRLIHNPGWTTIAQVDFANNLLETMNQQAIALRGLRNAIETHVKTSALGN